MGRTCQERGLGDPPEEDSSFFSFPGPLHNHPGSSQTILCARPPTFRGWRASDARSLALGAAVPGSSLCRGWVLAAVPSRGHVNWIPTLPTPLAPGSARVLATMQRALAYRCPPQGSREAWSPLTSCQFSFLGWVGKGPPRVASHPPHPGGGGEQSRVRAERQSRLPLAPVLQVSSGSGRSDRRGPGCLGGRPRVT